MGFHWGSMRKKRFATDRFKLHLPVSHGKSAGHGLWQEHQRTCWSRIQGILGARESDHRLQKTRGHTDDGWEPWCRQGGHTKIQFQSMLFQLNLMLKSRRRRLCWKTVRFDYALSRGTYIAHIFSAAGIATMSFCKVLILTGNGLIDERNVLDSIVSSTGYISQAGWCWHTGCWSSGFIFARNVQPVQINRPQVDICGWMSFIEVLSSYSVNTLLPHFEQIAAPVDTMLSKTAWTELSGLVKSSSTSVW